MNDNRLKEFYEYWQTIKGAKDKISTIHSKVNAMLEDDKDEVLPPLSRRLGIAVGELVSCMMIIEGIANLDLEEDDE